MGNKNVPPSEGDPRLLGLDSNFRDLIFQLSKVFGQLSVRKGGRATHTYGTTAFGVLTVLENPHIPDHCVFSSKKRYPVVLRHANIKGSQDDRIRDGRGASIRILQGCADDDPDQLDLHKFEVDILLSTGCCFILPEALSFGKWVGGTLDERAEMLQTYPSIASNLAEIIRDPNSYTLMHYYSQMTYNFIAKDESCYLVRYRLVNDENPLTDDGKIPSEEINAPFDYLPRKLDDKRSQTYLQEDFKKQIEKSGVRYKLQVQLRPASGIDEETAKDCTIPWDDTKYPFQDVASILLKEVLQSEDVEPLEFNPYHAPQELSLILAKRAQDKASLNHLRSIVYQISADMRKYGTPSIGMNGDGTELKSLFPYLGTSGVNLPIFDSTQPFPAKVLPSRRYLANLGLVLLPPRQFDALPLLGVTGVLEVMGSNVLTYMPPNLTRCNPDKLSDEFFVDRRLNGFNPGKLNAVLGQPGHYYCRYDCSNYRREPSGILPAIIEARFVLEHHRLKPYSIEFTLEEGENKQESKPNQSNWEYAKRLYRSAEFVFQEVQSHLGRCHINMEQYAMAYFRNIVNNPIRALLEPHFDGLLNINKLGASLIFGKTGFIPESSVLSVGQIESLLEEEIKSLDYHTWSPQVQALKDEVIGNHFDPAAVAMWEILEQYVEGFFAIHHQGICAYWHEIEGMSHDLVKHQLLDKKIGTLEIRDICDLEKLCVYIIYFNTFFHSWVNNKQYEDGGDPDYAAIGLWDPKHPAYDPIAVAQKQSKQTILLWSLSNVRYNPIMDVGPPALKAALWKKRDKITPGIPIDAIMMSINI
jgi:linolenate 9R-lipoxygenase